MTEKTESHMPMKSWPMVPGPKTKSAPVKHRRLIVSNVSQYQNLGRYLGKEAIGERTFQKQVPFKIKQARVFTGSHLHQEHEAMVPRVLVSEFNGLLLLYGDRTALRGVQAMPASEQDEELEPRDSDLRKRV